MFLMLLKERDVTFSEFSQLTSEGDIESASSSGVFAHGGAMHALWPINPCAQRLNKREKPRNKAEKFRCRLPLSFKAYN